MHVYCYATMKDGRVEYVVEPSMAHPRYFFISQLIEEPSETSSLSRPVAAIMVSDFLRGWGLTAPELADWYVNPSDGVTYTLADFGVPTPEQPEWMTRGKPNLGAQLR